MTRTIRSLILFFAIVSPAWAQTANFKFFAKAEGGNVQMAVEITPDLDCYFYHEDPGEYAQATVIEPGGIEGAAWTPVHFPEPALKDNGLGSYNKVYKKPTLFFAAALGVGEVDLSALEAAVAGQVCNIDGCVGFDTLLSDPKAGTDKVWDKFPAALLVSHERPGEAAESAAQDGPTWSPDFGDEKAMARYYARLNDDDEAELVIEIAVPPHFHMYGGPTEADKGPGTATPTTITIEGGGVDWGDVQFPRPEHLVPYADTPKEWVWAYGGTFHFGVKGEEIEGLEPEEIKILINGQSCDEMGCIPITDLTPAYAGEGEEAHYKAALASWTLPEIPEASRLDQEGGAAGAGGSSMAESSDGSADGDGAIISGGLETDSDSLLGFILLAISAGLITLLMPCTYPMIPITISYFTKQAESKGGNALNMALMYGLGIILMFVLIGVTLGPIIVTFATHWITNLVIAIVFVLFAFALFGMIDLRPPQAMMKLANTASSKGGYGGVFLMGLTLVVTSFTCTGPFVGSLLAAGADSSGETSMFRLIIGMGFFGLTMATPFVFLALVPGKLSTLPTAGAWMNTLKVFMGFVELAAALKFLSNADIARHWMLLPREVFLVLWAGIAFVAGYYLLGRINLKSESPDGNIGPGRLISAIGTILFGFYCLLGVWGYQLDSALMSALAPPPDYTRGLVPSHRSVGGAAIDLPAGVELDLGGNMLVVDDYDRAREVAQAMGLGLILNFTGHT